MFDPSRIVDAGNLSAPPDATAAAPPGPSRLTLLSWNIQGRVRRLDEQADRVAAESPDVVCLQEVTPTTLERWRQRLAEAGLPHAAAPAPHAPRRLHVLTASRRPLTPLLVPGVPWPERVLATDAGGLVLVNVHSPISPKPDLAKVRTHEALHAYLKALAGPALLCGDLNTPRKELPDGSVWTFARDRYGRLRPDRGERWDAAEQALVRGLERHGFRDAFRARHGYAEREPSWEWPRWGGGYRLDHLIVSHHLGVPEIAYRHSWRREGLSDHSALWARLTTEPAAHKPPAA